MKIGKQELNPKLTLIGYFDGMAWGFVTFACNFWLKWYNSKIKEKMKLQKM